MTSCFLARIFDLGERFGKPFYEVDVPRPLILNDDRGICAGAVTQMK